MKPIKRIVILTAIVVSIITFWLAPGIDQAVNAQYVRVYEDTFEASVKVKESKQLVNVPEGKRPEKADTTGRKSKKVYKEERIKRDAKLRDVNPKMFSRAIHFVQEIDTLKQDTVNLVKLPEGEIQ